jgi:GT2 family glycosyltransferase
VKIEIGIATANRAAIVERTIKLIRGTQTHQVGLLVSIASSLDFVDTGEDDHLKVLMGARGLTAQRNAILRNSQADLVAFFDDDFLPSPDFIEETLRLFSENPDIVVATGTVIADGARTGGLEYEDGLRLLADAGANTGGEPTATYGAYGCNMVVRMDAVRRGGITFDENLPLYGWQEDIDFSRQLAPQGRIVRSPRLRGVHLGTKRSGRSPGKQLGYSQIANPYYLVKKGTMSTQFAWRLVRNNVGGNIARFLRPEPTVDRRGRLLGNALAVRDILIRRCRPGRILEL